MFSYKKIENYWRKIQKSSEETKTKRKNNPQKKSKLHMTLDVLISSIVPFTVIVTIVTENLRTAGRRL